jgi:hypothetical protein
MPRHERKHRYHDRNYAKAKIFLLLKHDVKKSFDILTVLQFKDIYIKFELCKNNILYKEELVMKTTRFKASNLALKHAMINIKESFGSEHAYQALNMVHKGMGNRKYKQWTASKI